MFTRYRRSKKKHLIVTKYKTTIVRMTRYVRKFTIYASLSDSSHEVSHPTLQNWVVVCEKNYRTRQLRCNPFQHPYDRF